MPKGDKEGRLQLLDVPYHLLLKQIDQDEAERADQTLQANLARQEYVDRLERKGKGKDLGQKAMWVDKYRPTKFTDLLGEEVSFQNLDRGHVRVVNVTIRLLSDAIGTSYPG